MSGWIREGAVLDVLNQIENCWTKCLVNCMNYMNFSVFACFAQRPVAANAWSSKTSLLSILKA